MPWYAKATGGYSTLSVEAMSNALQIYYILTDRGWSFNPICGVLGNLQFESGMNPWRWQSDIILNSSDPAIDYSTTNAYGLFQFTPPGKYLHSPIARAIPGFRPNYSNSSGDPFDGYSQIVFVDENADYVATPQYPYSYAMYKVLALSPEDCADIWLANYERGTPSPYREQYARDWYDILDGIPAIPPELPPGYIGNLPYGAVAAATKKGGAAVANIPKRRMAGRPEARSCWQRKRN